MAGITIHVTGGGLPGADIPVHVGVAYTPDRVDPATAPIQGSANLNFDRSVVQVVSGSISAGGSHAPGSGSITWPGIELDGDKRFVELSASFVWIDYGEETTTFDASFHVNGGGTYSATPLVVPRPPIPEGLKLRKK